MRALAGVVLSDAEAHELGDGAGELSLDDRDRLLAKEAAIKIISPRLRR
jgi:hypothetical protein